MLIYWFFKFINIFRNVRCFDGKLCYKNGRRMYLLSLFNTIINYFYSWINIWKLSRLVIICFFIQIFNFFYYFANCYNYKLFDLFKQYCKLFKKHTRFNKLRYFRFIRIFNCFRIAIWTYSSWFNYFQIF